MTKRDVIVACDFKNKEDTMAFLGNFKEEKPFVKIGMELFYGEGPDIVKAIKDRGHNIFLDLKLHDIPNTVNKAMRNLARLGVDMTNVHAAGTIDMMRAALEGLAEGADSERALLIAVTQLDVYKRQGVITLERLSELMSANPARILGRESGIEEGKRADIAVIDLEKEYMVTVSYTHLDVYKRQRQRRYTRRKRGRFFISTRWRCST